MKNIVVIVEDGVVTQTIGLGKFSAEEHINNVKTIYNKEAIVAAETASIGDLVENGVVVGHAPFNMVSSKSITKLEYMDLFTDEELAAIYTAAKSIVQVEIWLEKFKAATEVNLDDPRIIAGLQALETAGLLQTGRAQEIIS